MRLLTAIVSLICVSSVAQAQASPSIKDVTPAGAHAPITLSWNTFSDAADQAGISRRYGGIHFKQGDLVGRVIGRFVGVSAWAKAQSYIQGGSEIPPVDLASVVPGVAVEGVPIDTRSLAPASVLQAIDAVIQGLT